MEQMAIIQFYKQIQEVDYENIFSYNWWISIGTGIDGFDYYILTSNNSKYTIYSSDFYHYQPSNSGYYWYYVSYNQKEEVKSEGAEIISKLLLFYF